MKRNLKYLIVIVVLGVLFTGCFSNKTEVLEEKKVSSEDLGLKETGDGFYLYDGDMLIPKDKINLSETNDDKRGFVKNSFFGVDFYQHVRYVISNDFSNYDKELIRKATKAWELAANIKFEEVSSGTIFGNEYLINVKNNIDAPARSTVGDIPFGRMEINLTQIGSRLTSYGKSYFIGLVVHELGHCLGLSHEHQRSDRNDFITVYKSGDNYDRLDGKEYTDYDYYSIMHYSSGNIDTKNNYYNSIIGQDKYLSKKDVKTVKKIFGSINDNWVDDSYEKSMKFLNNSATFLIRDKSGIRINNAKITIDGKNYYTDRNGKAEIKNLVIGKMYSVSIYKYGYLSDNIHQSILWGHLVEIDIEKIGRDVTFLVVDSNNNPVQGVQIELANNTNSCKTDYNGQAKMLVDGNTYLTMKKNGYATYKSSLPSFKSNIAVQLKDLTVAKVKIEGSYLGGGGSNMFEIWECDNNGNQIKKVSNTYNKSLYQITNNEITFSTEITKGKYFMFRGGEGSSPGNRVFTFYSLAKDKIFSKSFDFLSTNEILREWNFPQNDSFLLFHFDGINMTTKKIGAKITKIKIKGNYLGGGGAQYVDFWKTNYNGEKIKQISGRTSNPLFRITNETVSLNSYIESGNSFVLCGGEGSSSGYRTFYFYDEDNNLISSSTVNFGSTNDVLQSWSNSSSDRFIRFSYNGLKVSAISYSK